MHSCVENPTYDDSHKMKKGKKQLTNTLKIEEKKGKRRSIEWLWNARICIYDVL